MPAANDTIVIDAAAFGRLQQESGVFFSNTVLLQVQVDRLQVVFVAHPPQSDLHTQLHASGSAWYVEPQLSAAVSQTQPQVPAPLWNV